MLAKKRKFTKSDFDKIKENTIKRENTLFGLIYIMRPDWGKSTIVVAKKVYKKANERNKIKRIFYNLIRKSDINMAVFMKSKLSTIQFKQELFKIINK